MKKIFRSLLAASALASTTAFAALQVQTFSVTADDSANVDQSNPSGSWYPSFYGISKFQGSAASLKNVTVTLTTDFGQSYMATETDNGVSGNFTVDFVLGATLINSSNDLGGAFPSGNNVWVQASDYLDYNSPVSYGLNGSDTAIYSLAANYSGVALQSALAAFIGAGTFDFDVINQLDSYAGYSGSLAQSNVNYSLINRSMTTLTVTYDYQTPEPGTLALLSCAIYGLARSRRRTVVA